MSDSYQISDEEKALFRQAMRGVKPLHAKTTTIMPGPAVTKIAAPKIQHRVKRQQRQILPIANYEKLTSDHTDVPMELSSEDLMQFSRSGIQHRELRKLHRGTIAIQASLDLHKLTVNQALQECRAFIAHCQKNHLRYVLVIHGKAKYASYKPILKNALNYWLREQSAILAFHSATPRHGGTGAVYLLIKTARMA